jgi:FMN-dependent oxidoreductase (nitrilotriacetate monooxygenase family)
LANRMIRLGASVKGLGYHPSGWLDPDVPADGGMSLPFYIDLARTLERGLFDILFLADHSAFWASDVPKGALGRTAGGAELEPITLLSALSAVTSHIGLVSTTSTTLHQPFQMARQFGSLDHLSGGRAGWNVVTSSRDAEARNFGEEKILEKSLRYERAKEALEICFGLWDSWEEGAFPHDRKSGIFFDVSKMHPINHKGKFFRVDGPLTMPPSPQGRPVIFQAGASEGGMDFAASCADVIYALANELDDAKAAYAAMKQRVQKFGRAPDDIKIMPGLLAVVAETREEAQARFRQMQKELDPLVGLQRLGRHFGDLSKFDIDAPLPAEVRSISGISRSDRYLAQARRMNWSIRQLYENAVISDQHLEVVGSPSDVADVMEQWFTEGAADGFNILPAKSPRDIHAFVDLVVPELQRRGLFRTAYEASTLRGNLGLPAVVSRHGKAAG